jgi:hypothetical protein
MAEQRFTARLEESERGGGRWLEVPLDPKAVFGEARARAAKALEMLRAGERLS